MKTTFQLLGACIGLSQLAVCEVHPSFEPKDWPRYVLRFSEEGTLKDIFDAGIRPYRFPSLEKSSLGFKHARVSIETKFGVRLPEIEVEWGDISPLDGGLLSDVEMTSPNLTTEEAEAAMIPFLKRGARTEAQLKKFLALVDSDPVDYDDPYHGRPDKFGITWEDEKGPKYAVYFKKTFDRSKPVSIALNARWTTKHRTMRQLSSFYDIPIPPPPGYENVSMEAPRNFGPDSAVEIARSKGIPITGDRSLEEYEKQWLEANGKDRAPKSGISESGVTSIPPKKSINWPWIIAGVLLLGILALLCKVWMGKSAR